MRPNLSWLTIAAVSLLASTVDGATHRVPETFPKIQLAIDAAAPGDTVLVGPGFYDENLHTQGKFLALIGSAGAEATIVDGGRRDRVVRFDGGGCIEGFTLQNGQAVVGAGVSIGGSNGPAVIQHNIIRNNIAGFVFDTGVAGGIYAEAAGPPVTITRNIIEDNIAGADGGGVYGASYPQLLFITDNIIQRNRCHVSGGGAWLSGATFERNLVYANHSDSFAGGVFVRAGTIRSNTVVANSHYNTIYPAAAGIYATGGTITHNIIAYSSGPREIAAGILCPSSGEFSCNVSWGNAGPDFLLGNCDTTGTRNISADPLFCDVGAGDFSLSPNSPCAPTAPSGCGLVGAREVEPGCGVTPTRRTSWGRLKTIYR